MYLDSDLIVNGSLDDFWSISLDGYLLAAASDRNLDMQRARLGLASDSPYFNAGVMVLNLSDWRQLDVGARGLDFARKYPEKLPNCDQDVLTISLKSGAASLINVGMPCPIFGVLINNG